MFYEESDHKTWLILGRHDTWRFLNVPVRIGIGL